MRRYDKTLKRYVEETEASDLELRHVANRLDEEFGRRGSLRQSLLDLPTAGSGAEERVLVRLDSTRARPSSLAARLRSEWADPRLAWRGPAGLALAALLVIGLVVVRDAPPQRGASEIAEGVPQAVPPADRSPDRTAEGASAPQVADAPPVHAADGASAPEVADAPSVHAAEGASAPRVVDAPSPPAADDGSGAEVVEGPSAPDEEPGSVPQLAEAPDDAADEAPAPSALAVTDLASATAWTSLAVSTDVGLRFLGAGRLQGTARAPRVAWTRGTVEVEVEPERGIDFQLETPEGLVTVVGTAFEVTRDITGTSVSVRRGKVRVACVEGETVLLTRGQNVTCRPATPAGFLARARLLVADGEQAQSVLTLVDRGLRDARPGPVHDELLYLRIEQLLLLGRRDEARSAADLYLGQPSRPRSDDIRELFSSDR